MKNEKESLERENDQLKEALEAERAESRRSRMKNHGRVEENLHEELSVTDAKQNLALRSQFQKAMHHLATCKRKKCPVCAYTKSVFGSKRNKYDKKIFSCLQTPFLEVKNMLKPPPSPMHGVTDGETLSEWFLPLERFEGLDEAGTAGPSECSSITLPFADMTMSYMDERDDNWSRDDESREEYNFIQYNETRAFGSDSGFCSDVCGEFKSEATTPKDKFCPKATLDESECAKLTRTKWTASFRKLINKIKK